MKVVVIDPPEAIVSPTDIPGVEAGDAFVQELIAAATAEIDGPDGTLRRCLGEQKLQLTAFNWACVPFPLPYPPLISIDSVRYVDPDGAIHDIDAEKWSKSSGGGLQFLPSFALPTIADRPDAVIVEYTAGYNGPEGTGNVPSAAKVAIIMAVNQLRSLSGSDAFKKVDFVEGVGRTEFAVSSDVGRVMNDATERLLAGLRVYR